MSRRRPTAGLRRRLLLTVTLAVTVAVVVTFVAFNLVLDARLDTDANDLARSRATAALGGVQVVDGTLRAREAPDDMLAFDRPIWIFAGHRELERPLADPHVQQIAATLAGGPQRIVDVPGEQVRLLALPVAHKGRRIGTVVAGVSLTPYERIERLALMASLALGALLLAIAVLAARWLLAAGLRPVARMTSDAAAWSEHDLDRRFALGPPHDELTQLAATLDGLLDRLAAGLRREQRFSAELSHELRTPLARVRARAQLALGDDAAPEESRDALAAVLRGTDDVTRTLDALLTAARVQPEHRGTADAHAVARAVVEDCAALAGERGVELALERVEGPARIGADPELAERALHPIVENACRYAAGEVRVAVRRAGSAVLFEVTDDGLGVAAGEEDRIFQPGERGSAGEHRGGTVSAGLGLALAQRLARAAGGDVEARSGPGGRFVLRLPAA